MRKSRRTKDQINNFIMVVILISFLWSLYAIFKNDKEVVDRFLTECRKRCYPAEIVESISRRRCLCQEIQQEEQDIDVQQ